MSQTIPAKMRTVEIKEFGKPEMMEIGERNVPEIKENEVLVKIDAAGVNGPDIMQRKGLYPPPKGASDIMGLEVSGVVVAVGENVKRWKIGEEICGLTNGGGYAEYVAINQDHCLSVPPNVSVIDAAGLPETYFTVWSNVFFQQSINENDTLLVHGGAGGIGTTAIQLANAKKMRVFTTASTKEKCQFCENIGAEKAIEYTKENFLDIVKDAGGADIIIDTIGGEYMEKNIKCCKMDARIVQLAFNKGSKITADFMLVMLKRITITGSTLRPRPVEFKSAVARDIEKNVWEMFEAQTIKPLTYKVFKLDEVKQAHKMMEDKKHYGKILIRP